MMQNNEQNWQKYVIGST